MGKHRARRIPGASPRCAEQGPDRAVFTPNSWRQGSSTRPLEAEESHRFLASPSGHTQYCSRRNSAWLAEPPTRRPRSGAILRSVSQGHASSDELRRRLAGWKAAERREREIRRQEPVPEPAESFDQALELIELAWLELEHVDAVREREERRARTAWAKLRRRLGWQASAPERR